MRSILSNRYHKENRRKLDRRCPNMGRYTRYALYVAIMSAAWISFKKFEADIFPVVTEFKVTSAQAESGKRFSINGSFNKVRPCMFIEVLGYSDNQFVSIAFAALPGAQVPSRLLGVQTYGPWLLAPEVSNLKLYYRHQCSTGEVITNIFDGTIVTLKTNNAGE